MQHGTMFSNSRSSLWLLLGAMCLYSAAVQAQPNTGSSATQQHQSQSGEREMRALILLFLEKLEWHTPSGRAEFVERNSDGFFDAIRPERAKQRGLVPLTATGLDKLASRIKEEKFSEEERTAMKAELDAQIRQRNIRDVLGRIWKWLCQKTGDGCSADEGGGSVAVGAGRA